MASTKPPGGGRSPQFSALMAAQLGNDLRVVLSAIVSSLDAIRGRVPVDVGVDAYFAEIDGAIDTAFHICRELTLLGAPARPEPSIVDVNEVALRTQGLVRRVLGNEIKLELVLNATTPVVRADETQLEWLLLNLAANARDAMPRGGVMTIETSLVDARAGTAGETRTERRGHVRLTVIDTGHGMTDEVRERAFEPFFSTRTSAAGLGLTSVALTVWNLGGKLRLLDREPAGTEVRVYLPLLDAQTPPAAP
jgi:signal transduction histidine kinase